MKKKSKYDIMKEIEKKQRLLEHLIRINGKEKEIAKLIINIDKLEAML